MRIITAEELNKTMENAEIFTANSFSREGYIAELLRFQRFASELVVGDGEARMDEVIAVLSGACRRNGAVHNANFALGLRALKDIEKDLAILMSGKNSEERVAHSLSFVTRKYFRNYQNVYVTEQYAETELDDVVLTDKGIIIIEVKAAKNNITISSDGRLLYANGESYHNESIGDKMSAKRRLLKSCIEAKLAERGLDIPVLIDSYIVFDCPGYMSVSVTDNFRREHWCRRGKLQFLVSEFTSDVTYSNEALEQLEEILADMENNAKRYPIDLDLRVIRQRFAMLYELASDSVAAETQNIYIDQELSEAGRTAVA